MNKEETYKQGFDFLLSKKSCKIDPLSLKFTDKAKEERYRQESSIITGSKFKNILGINLLLSVLVVSLLSLDLGFDPTVLTVHLLLAIIILICFFSYTKARKKRLIRLFSTAIVLTYLVPLVVLYFTSTDFNVVKTVFLMFTAITYFHLTLFYSYSLFKSVLLASVSFLFMALIFIKLDDDHKPANALVTVIVLVIFELYSYLKELAAKVLFSKKDQNLTIVRYFREVLSKMNNGLFIVNDNNLIFSNSEMDEFLENYCELSKEDDFSISNLEEVFDQKLEKLDVGKFSEKSLSRKNIDAKKTSDDLQRAALVVQDNFEDVSFYEEKEKKKVINVSEALEGQAKQKKINFNNLGIFKTKEKPSKFYEIFISVHSFKENSVCELMVNDLTALLKYQNLKEENKLNSKMVAKISHEFISHLISLRTRIDEIKHNLKEYDYELFQPRIAELKSMKYLNEYLFYLMNEMSSYLRLEYKKPDLKEDEGSKEENKLKRMETEFDRKMSIAAEDVFDLVPVVKKAEKIARAYKDMTDSKARLVNLKVSMVAEQKDFFCDSPDCAEFNNKDYDYTKFSVEVNTNLMLFEQFLVNILITLVKIVTKGEIVVKLNVVDFINKEGNLTESRASGEETIEIILEADTNVDFDKANLAADYSTSQGIDITIEMLQRLSEELELNLRWLRREDKAIFQFNLRCSVVNSALVSGKIVFGGEEVDDDEETEEANFDLGENRMMDLVVKEEKKTANNYKTRRTHQLSVLEGEMKEELVLVVDDLGDVRKSMSTLLKKIYKGMGVRVVQLDDGIELLHFVYMVSTKKTNKVIKLVISDEFMNYLNGSEAAVILNRLAGDQKISSIPFISYTAFRDDQNMSNIDRADPIAILNKPANMQTLKNVLEEHDLI